MRGSRSRDDHRIVLRALVPTGVCQKPSRGRHVTDTVEDAYRSGETQIFLVSSGSGPYSITSQRLREFTAIGTTGLPRSADGP